jgi:hypothetical protein
MILKKNCGSQEDIDVFKQENKVFQNGFNKASKILKELPTCLVRSQSSGVGDSGVMKPQVELNNLTRRGSDIGSGSGQQPLPKGVSVVPDGVNRPPPRKGSADGGPAKSQRTQ